MQMHGMASMRSIVESVEVSCPLWHFLHLLLPAPWDLRYQVRWSPPLLLVVDVKLNSWHRGVKAHHVLCEGDWFEVVFCTNRQLHYKFLERTALVILLLYVLQAINPSSHRRFYRFFQGSQKCVYNPGGFGSIYSCTMRRCMDIGRNRHAWPLEKFEATSYSLASSNLFHRLHPPLLGTSPI